jgi:beta-lactamase regulating signal transducer with metallopeptidase domain
MAIHMVVEALFWFHPVVWLIKHRLIEEQDRFDNVKMTHLDRAILTHPFV